MLTSYGSAWLAGMVSNVPARLQDDTSGIVLAKLAVDRWSCAPMRGLALMPQKRSCGIQRGAVSHVFVLWSIRT